MHRIHHTPFTREKLPQSHEVVRSTLWSWLADRCRLSTDQKKVVTINSQHYQVISFTTSPLSSFFFILAFLIILQIHYRNESLESLLHAFNSEHLLTFTLSASSFASYLPS